MTYYWMGNYGAARPWFEKARELELDNVALYDVLGYSLFLLGDLAGARREYEAYRALRPEEPKAHYGVGLVELDEAHLPDAERCFARAIELFDALETRDPRQAAARTAERAECYARLAEVHFARADYAAAKTELERATALCPANISAFHTLGLVYRRLGDEARAAEALAHYENARQALVQAQGTPR
jgi:Flp pilus assembly protein TadD